MKNPQIVTKLNRMMAEDGVKHPVNADLEDKIKEFRFFALDICGLITDETKKAEKITLLEGCEVLSVEFDKGPNYVFLRLLHKR